MYHERIHISCAVNVKYLVQNVEKLLDFRLIEHNTPGLGPCTAKIGHISQ